MSLVATQSESIDISSLRAAILRPLEPEPDDRAISVSFTTHEHRLPATRPECHQAHLNTTGADYGKASVPAGVRPVNSRSTQDAGMSDSLHPLASTVPDSQAAEQAVQTMGDRSPEHCNPLRPILPRMSSQNSLPQDTQPLSQSILENIVSRNRSAHQLRRQDSDDAEETQNTLNEGDDGHVDIISSLPNSPRPHVEDEGYNGEAELFSQSQYQLDLPRFPESQRFKTPATAGKKRDYNGNFVDSPQLPLNPLTRIGISAPGEALGLSQVFAGTQAVSSPFASSMPAQLPSDRPSPNIALQVRPTTATITSPLLAYHTSNHEPFVHYKSISQSQVERDRRARSEGFEEDDSDDEFAEQSSIIRRRQWEKDRDKRVRRQFDAMSSPVHAKPRAAALMLSSSSRKFLSSSSPKSDQSGEQCHALVRLPELYNNHDLERDSYTGQKITDSEDETDQEVGHDVAVKRSSQPPRFTEEDKENVPSDQLQIPETAARLQQVLTGLAEVQPSPLLQRTVDHELSTEPQHDISEPFAVPNSQPSQNNRRSNHNSAQKHFYPAIDFDMVPQSQPPCQPPVSSTHSTIPDSRQLSGLLETHTQAQIRQLQETRCNVGSKPPQGPIMPAIGQSVQQRVEGQEAMSVNNPDVPCLPSEAVQLARAQSLYETAPTHASSESDPKPRYTDLETPRGARKLTMMDIAAEPSPPRSVSEDLNNILATTGDPDIAELFKSQTPIRPGRQPKRQRLQTRVNQPTSSSALSTGAESQVFAVQDKFGNLQERDLEHEPDFSHRLTQSVITRNQSRKALKSTVNKTTDDATSSTSQRVGTRRSRGDIWDLQATPPAKIESHGGRITGTALQKRSNLNVDPERSSAKQSGPYTGTRQAAQVPDPNSTSRQKIPASDPCLSLPLDGTLPTGSVIFPNNVWAVYNGRSRAYYPAKCLGVSGSDVLKYNIQWQGYDPDEVDVHGVRAFDLRVGDVVKVHQEGFPKLSHVIRGLKDHVGSQTFSEAMTDIRGYQTALVALKQRKSLPAGLDTEIIREVPVSGIYLDSNMWGQMKDRVYEYAVATQEDAASGFITPTARPSTPSTPSSRSRRVAASTTVVDSADCNGLFAGMAFAISYDPESLQRVTLAPQIRANGGLLLTDGFHTMLDPETIQPKTGYSNMGFCALLADRHSRKEKYMQALALHLPCISGLWIGACLRENKVLNWEPYLLPAGESALLDGATRSRILPPLNPEATTLAEMLNHRPNILHGATVVVIIGRGKDEEKLKPYPFLVQAMRAGRVEKVPDINRAKEILKEGGVDWIVVDEKKIQSTRTTLEKGRKEKLKVRVAGTEMVKQSLIIGQLYEEQE